ncbi:MAG: hypothetical protein Ct9H300mP7_6690 [Verrucomicrobiota bacterium]|nr:MAG: hypothetical protein Ct9H300mP7_6690 [Verrucomicrobiota bacterium]
MTIKKDDAWTVFLKEREELIEFWDGLDKGVLCLPAIAQQLRDQDHRQRLGVRSGPHNSINHAPMKDEGGRPPNGRFKYGPRACDIRWSSYAWRISHAPTAPSRTTAWAGQQRLQNPVDAGRAVVRLPPPAGDLPVPRRLHRRHAFFRDLRAGMG